MLCTHTESTVAFFWWPLSVALLSSCVNLSRLYLSDFSLSIPIGLWVSETYLNPIEHTVCVCGSLSLCVCVEIKAVHFPNGNQRLIYNSIHRMRPNSQSSFDTINYYFSVIKCLIVINSFRLNDIKFDFPMVFFVLIFINLFWGTIEPNKKPSSNITSTNYLEVSLWKIGTFLTNICIINHYDL